MLLTENYVNTPEKLTPSPHNRLPQATWPTSTPFSRGLYGCERREGGSGSRRQTTLAATMAVPATNSPPLFPSLCVCSFDSLPDFIGRLRITVNECVWLPCVSIVCVCLVLQRLLILARVLFALLATNVVGLCVR